MKTSIISKLFFNFLIFLFFLLFITNILNSEDLNLIRYGYDYNKLTKEKLIPQRIIDSLKNSNNIKIENSGFFKFNNRYFGTGIYYNNIELQNNGMLFSYDTSLNRIKLYTNTQSSRLTGGIIFFTFNNNFFYISHVCIDKPFHKNKYFLSIFYINANSMDSCKKYIINDQEETWINWEKNYPLIWVENNKLKFKISSIKFKFNYLWLLLGWAPRGAPEKWEYDDKTQKDYIYTFDKDIKLISIKKIPVEKDDY